MIKMLVLILMVATLLPEIIAETREYTYILPLLISYNLQMMIYKLFLTQN